MGLIPAPPDNHADKGSQYMPPAQPSNLPVQGGHVRQLDIEAVDKGAILIDLGSMAHVEHTDEDRELDT